MHIHIFILSVNPVQKPDEIKGILMEEIFAFGIEIRRKGIIKFQKISVLTIGQDSTCLNQQNSRNMPNLDYPW